MAEVVGAVDLGDFVDDAGLDGGLRGELGVVGGEELVEGDVVFDGDDGGGLGVAAMFEAVS